MEALTGRTIAELQGNVTDLSQWNAPHLFEIATVQDVTELLMYGPSHTPT